MGTTKMKWAPLAVFLLAVFWLIRNPMSQLALVSDVSGCDCKETANTLPSNTSTSPAIEVAPPPLPIGYRNYGIQDNYNISVSIILIATSTRSSSTFLSKDILGTMPCHISMNEILLGGMNFAGDAWRVEAMELGMPKESKWNGNQNGYHTAF